MRIYGCGCGLVARISEEGNRGMMEYRGIAVQIAGCFYRRAD